MFICECSKPESITFISKIDNETNIIKNMAEYAKLILKHQKPKPTQITDECNVLKSLREDNSVSIVPADKCSVTVVVDSDACE